jgi:hypothetical protein
MGLSHSDPERLRREASAKQAAHQEELRASSVSLSEAADLTGASADRLRRLVGRGDMLAFSVEDDLRVPSWQLQRSEVAPALSGVVEVAAVFPGDLADLSDWIQRSHTDLDGYSPAEALKQGQANRVVALARAIGAAGR